MLPAAGRSKLSWPPFAPGPDSPACVPRRGSPRSASRPLSCRPPSSRPLASRPLAASATPRPGCGDMSDSMASCSRWRSAPAPADAPRWAELSNAGPPPPVGAPPPPPLLPPPCFSWITAISWPLRIRPTPVMPIDCASRCSSGNSIPESPGPPRRAARSVTASPAAAPRVGGAPLAVAAVSAPTVFATTEGCCSGAPDWPGDASEIPEEPVKISVVSLTRGPSQGAGGGRGGGRSTRCHDPANRPGQVLRVVPSPHRRGMRLGASLVPGSGPRRTAAGSARTARPTGKCRSETRRLGRPALLPGQPPAHDALRVLRVRRRGSDLRADEASPTVPGGKAGLAASDGRAPGPMTGYLVQHPP